MEGNVSQLLQQPVNEFEGFGPSLLSRACREDTFGGDPFPRDRLAARSMLHDTCPITSGIYAWLDDNDQICYVGKSKCLRKRLLSYFAKTPADKKVTRIVQHSRRIVWEPVSHELLALIREQELINRWRPDFNTQGQPVRRQPAFIGISGGAAPHVFFSRRITGKAAVLFGPLNGTTRLRAAVDSLNQVFQLRDCPDRTRFHFSDQRTLFDDAMSARCIRYELGSCPAPCASRCSVTQYMSGVTRASQFLAGGAIVDETIERIEQSMQSASIDCQFERAVVLRDHLTNLQWLARRLESLRDATRTINGVLPLPGKRRLKLWLVLRGGQVVGSAAEPRGRERTRTAIQRLATIAAQDIAQPDNLMQMNLQMIVTSWFRRQPEDRERLVPFETAIGQCERRLVSR